MKLLIKVSKSLEKPKQLCVGRSKMVEEMGHQLKRLQVTPRREHLRAELSGKSESERRRKRRESVEGLVREGAPIQRIISCRRCLAAARNT